MIAHSAGGSTLGGRRGEGGVLAVGACLRSGWSAPVGVPCCQLAASQALTDGCMGAWALKGPVMRVPPVRRFEV
jgi:hypothetical protein